jgi:hypothetical protein
VALALFDYAIDFVMGCIGSKTKTVEQPPDTKIPLFLLQKQHVSIILLGSCFYYIFLIVKCAGLFTVFPNVTELTIIYVLEIGL